MNYDDKWDADDSTILTRQLVCLLTQSQPSIFGVRTTPLNARITSKVGIIFKFLEMAVSSTW